MSINSLYINSDEVLYLDVVEILNPAASIADITLALFLGSDPVQTYTLVGGDIEENMDQHVTAEYKLAIPDGDIVTPGTYKIECKIKDSLNNEFGVNVDPRTVTFNNLRI